MRILTIIILLTMTLTSYGQWNTIGQSNVEPTGKDIPNPQFNPTDSTTHLYNKYLQRYVEVGHKIWVDDFIEDGDTGDHEAFQRAVDFGIVNGDRSINFKDRKYVLRDTVLIDANNFILIGQGMGAIEFAAGTTPYIAGTMITTDAIQNCLINCTQSLMVKDIFFDGGSNAPKFADSGIIFSNPDVAPPRPTLFFRCRFNNFDKAINVVDRIPVTNDVVIGGTLKFESCMGQGNNYGFFVEDGCHIQALHITDCNFRNNFRMGGRFYAQTVLENNIFEGQDNFLDATIDGTVYIRNNYYEVNGGDYIMRLIGSSSALSYRTYLRVDEQNNMAINPATGIEQFPNWLTTGYCILDMPRTRGNTMGILRIEKELINNQLAPGTNLGYGGGWGFRSDTHGDTSSAVTVWLNPMNYLGVQPYSSAGFAASDTFNIAGSEFANGTLTTFDTPFGVKQGVNITQQEILNVTPFTYAQGDIITVSMLVRFNDAGAGESTGLNPVVELLEGAFVKAFNTSPEIYSVRKWNLVATTFRARSAGTSADIRFGPDTTNTGQDCDVACLSVQKVTPASVIDGSVEYIIPHVTMGNK